MNILPSRGNVSLFDELFRDFTPGFFIKPLHGDPLPSQIKIDVKESETQFTVHAEIPGVSKEDIHVEVDGPLVTIKAEVRQADSERKDERQLRTERFYGAVSRSFQLPAEIERNAASAKYENGVLSLTLPKKQGGQGGQRLRIE
ncbi:Hsp20/alpha crystallin family protein [Chromobacterium haemolyticum]|uniref:Hsp20/alpha crystallin family protein n=1 Tax=Chromobacterium fluminis TaxID=3044269 RepID=A0ABX0KZ16_9NEIS|nr:Hsp20/alpha crystallin family protein [Chromobacterium haemolyticum]NHR04036.1 Hsp20/alpha crystallin family protein [Chromobacterium haemolyticum]